MVFQLVGVLNKEDRTPYFYMMTSLTDMVII